MDEFDGTSGHGLGDDGTWRRHNEDDGGGQDKDSSGDLMGLKGGKGYQGKGQYIGYCHQCGQCGHTAQNCESTATSAIQLWTVGTYGKSELQDRQNGMVTPGEETSQAAARSQVRGRLRSSIASRMYPSHPNSGRARDRRGDGVDGAAAQLQPLTVEQERRRVERRSMENRRT